MSANQLALTNIINISVSQSQTGIGNYNTSNLALFSEEVPANSFGTAGYSIYLSPTQVGIDFGTSSKTYAMANAVFSQQPNILSGGGYLVVILMAPQVIHIALSGVAASGAFELTYGGNSTTSLPYTSTAAQIQSALQLVPGCSSMTVSGSIASQVLNVTMAGTYGNPATPLSVSANTLQTSGSSAITFTFSIGTAGTTLDLAITASVGLVQFFGIIVSATITEIGGTNVAAIATVVQALNKICFLVSYNQSDIAGGGTIDLLRSGNETQTRGLYYGDSSTVSLILGYNALIMMAAYAGRALSVNFYGSNTTMTMHLKPLATVQPDPTITQTILNTAIAAGADTYVSLQGVSAVFCSGTNQFYDQVYNLQWFVGALQVAGFNYLAQANTKIPQTEPGMDGLKGAYRNVCEQAVTNQYSAPGQWNSPSTFGVLADFYNNISQRGYYIYSQPVAQQSQANRAARQAPLIQIALKQAGAIQSSNVLIFVNA